MNGDGYRGLREGAVSTLVRRSAAPTLTSNSSQFGSSERVNLLDNLLIPKA